MAARTGRLGNMAFAKESSWGNFATATKALRISTESLKRTVEHAEDPSLVSEIYTTDMIKIGDGMSGGIEGVLHGDDIGFMIHGILGTQSSLANPIKAWLLVTYGGSLTYVRLTKTAAVLTAEKSTNGSSWSADTNFSSTGSITLSDASYDTLTELQTYIAARTGYDAVIFGDSCDSTTLADFTATTLISADTKVGGCLMKVQPTSTVAKLHTVIPAGATVNLPSFSFLINRVLGSSESLACVGAKISTIALSNTAKDLCKYSLTIDGKQELQDKTDSVIATPTVEGYLTANMKICVEDNVGALTVLDEVKDFSLTINSNIDDNRTIGSYYKQEQERQNSTIEFSFTANNTTTQYALRTKYESDLPISLYVYFKGNDYADATNLVPYNILFRLPECKLTDYNSPLSTPDRLTITGAGKVIKPQNSTYTEHIYAYITDANTSSY